ncbi:hypothetical protein [Sphingomonas phyllosphaerae]|uniref:hypothetical protein n=1 Tax=Sphingomonas phyllosphaerae TaxID=257003 RepID=UPI00241311F1|nr:hypothetical protein [Sphingomonas phyllosphaerae]
MSSYPEHMGQRRRPAAVDVQSAAEGIRTAARLARPKTDIVAAADRSASGKTDRVIEAMGLFADELHAIADHVTAVKSPRARPQ